MGFFSGAKEVPTKLHTCKLCQRDFADENFAEEFGLCKVCCTTTLSYIENCFLPMLQHCEDSANAATDPDHKIIYYESMLETLYEYKFKYQDNDVKLMKQDISDDIAAVVDKISHVRD